MLEAALGTGEDFGKLRLAALGLQAFKLARAAKSKEILVVKVPLPDGTPAETRPREPVELVRHGQEIVLKLPIWARPRPATSPRPFERTVSVTSQLLGDPAPGRAAADKPKRR